MRPNALPESQSCRVLRSGVELTTDIGHDVVADDQRSGDEEPNQSLQDVVDEEVTGYQFAANAPAVSLTWTQR